MNGPHNRLGQSYALLAMTPVVAGHEIALRRHLRALPEGPASPLGRLPGVHFARWVTMDQPAFQGAPMRPDPFKSQYLLFSACFDGELAPFLDDLCDLLGEDADAIWQHCVGYPGRGDRAAFARYFMHNQIDTEVYFSAYPDATVARVRDSLARRDELIAFAASVQGVDDDELHRRWSETFGSGR